VDFSIVGIAVVAGASLILQAQFSKYRLSIMITVSTALLIWTTSTTNATMIDILSAVPWSVIVLLTCLGVYSKVLARTGVFQKLAVGVSEAARGSGDRLLFLSCGLLYVVSCFVNNLAAMLLVLPIVFEVLRAIGGPRNFRFVLLGLLIPACNLGGAATPIGDFPALLLLSQGKIHFGPYLASAGSICTIVVALLISLVWLRVRQSTLRRVRLTEVESRVLIDTMRAKYSGLRLDIPLLTIAAVVLGLMLFCWWGAWLSPELVAMLGVSLLIAGFLALTSARNPRRESVLKGLDTLYRRIRSTRRDPDALHGLIEAVPILFFTSLFLIVGCVQESGFLILASDFLEVGLGNPQLQFVVLILVISLVSALFSAGPGMALAIPVVDSVLPGLPAAPENDVYVAVALAICAGSCFFLSSATAGPILQRENEMDVRLRGQPDEAHFGLNYVLRTGIFAYFVVLAAALTWTFTRVL